MKPSAAAVRASIERGDPLTVREDRIDPMSLRVTALAIIGTEHDYLQRILTSWVREGFIVDGPELDYAEQLLEKIAADQGEEQSPDKGKAA